MPAHDLERLVTAEWHSLLATADLDVQLEVDAPEISTLIRNAAQRLSDTWMEMALPAQRHALLVAGLQVTVGRTQLRLRFAREGLLALLERTPPSVLRRPATDDGTALIRTVEAEVIRLHGETRILEDETETARAVAPMHQTLLRAIAQGRVWHRQLVSGEVTLPTLALQVGVATSRSSASCNAPG